MNRMLHSLLLCFFYFFIAANARSMKYSKCLCTADIYNGTIRGTIAFYDSLHRNTYRVEGVLYGLKPGYHGFHVHEKSDLSNGCAAAGPHYNPTGETHGCHHTDQRHAGDLGSIYANENGVASFSKEILGQLNYPHQICSRSIVVHADVDDCGQGGHEDSLTTGHSGQRIACAVIAPRMCRGPGNGKYENLPSKGNYRRFA